LHFAASQKARIECAEIAEDAKRAILQGNAQRLLGVGKRLQQSRT